MPVPNVTDKYIIFQFLTPDQVQEDSLYAVWVSKELGIQQIMCKKLNGEIAVQSYLFDKNSFTIEEARSYLKQHKAMKTNAELLSSKKLRVTANLKLCNSLPKLAVNSNISELTAESLEKMSTEAGLNDKYFFYVEGVHEGVNGNNCYFYRDELTENYKSAGHQPFDWEHMGEQIIGSSLEAELVSKVEEPLALGINGILWRLSPYMQKEERVEGDRLATRDELVKQRFFEEKLAVSMECLFDRIRCTKCEQEFTNWLDYEFHVYDNHIQLNGEVEEGVHMGLIGVDFVGWGIVEFPADHEAYVSGLRTSDDNTIKDIADASQKAKYGSIADNVVFANQIIEAKPDDFVVSGKNMVFASEKMKKSAEKITKTNDKGDNKLENISRGGNTMFDLLKKCKEAMTLNDAFVIAMLALKEFEGELTAEAREAFVTEFGEVAKTLFEVENFEVGDIYTITKEKSDELVSEAVTAKTEEESVKLTEVQEKLTSAETQLETLKADKSMLEGQLEEKKSEIAELEKKEEEKEKDKKVETFMSGLAESGVSLGEFFEAEIRKIVKSKLEGEPEKVEEELDKFKTDLIANVKQTTLSNASQTLGNTSMGGDSSDNSLTEKYEKLREKHEKGKED